MAVYLDDQALKKAAKDMQALKERNQALHEMLEAMYKNLTTALDTPAGHAIEWAGKEVLLEPIEDMSKVLQHVSDTLNLIIGSEIKGQYYDKIFTEYEELDKTIKNKLSY